MYMPGNSIVEFPHDLFGFKFDIVFVIQI